MENVRVHRLEKKLFVTISDGGEEIVIANGGSNVPVDVFEIGGGHFALVAVDSEKIGLRFSLNYNMKKTKAEFWGRTV